MLRAHFKRRSSFSFLDCRRTVELDERNSMTLLLVLVVDGEPQARNASPAVKVQVAAPGLTQWLRFTRSQTRPTRTSLRMRNELGLWSSHLLNGVCGPTEQNVLNFSFPEKRSPIKFG